MSISKGVVLLFEGLVFLMRSYVLFCVLFCVVGQYWFFYASVLSVYAKNCCKTDTIFIIKVALSGLV